MRIDVGQHMRMSQQMKLTPRMIQSMEILQLPAAALEERLEQELASNPTLELREPGVLDREQVEQEREQSQRDAAEGERELVTGDDTSGSDDFERLSNISEDYGDSWTQNTYESDRWDRSSAGAGRYSGDGERDGKMDAMANTAARSASLTDQLMGQWHLAEVPEHLREAGEFLIEFIDDDGYLRTPMSDLRQQSPSGITEPLMLEALLALQKIVEPVGIGARDIRECLLLQIDARREQLMQTGQNGVNHNSHANGQLLNGHHLNDHAHISEEDEEATADDAPDVNEPLAVERLLVDKYLKDIEVNRLPKIAKATGLDIEQVKQGIMGLRAFHPHPGRLLVEDTPHLIRPDVIVEYDEVDDVYVARLHDDKLTSLTINNRYAKLSKDRDQAKETRDFVKTNLQNARWLLDAIAQRQNTLLRVVNVVLNAQREFFDQGPQYLKPLPMTQVAEQLGVHVATVSRAVSEKYLQTPRGIYPLRMFFSGGTETEEGDAVSWTAVQAKLKEVIDEEDKSKPLSDDALVDVLKEKGIEIARRTVAKYRKQLNIPPARQRREY